MSLAFVAILYFTAGPAWDMIVQYLNAKAMVNPALYSTTWSINTAQVGGLLYFENFREPVESALMIPLLPLGGATIPAYLLVEFALLAAGTWRFSKSFRINTVIAFAVMFNPYTLYYLFTFNGTDGLSLAFVLLGIASIADGSPLAGLFLSLGALSKYPVLLTLPLVLLLGDRAKMTKAAELCLLPMLPWFLFNLALFGNPLGSYISELQIAVSNAPTVPLLPGTLLAIFEIPLAFLLLGAAIYAFAKRGRFKGIRVRKDVRAYILFYMLLTSALEFVFVEFHDSQFTEARFAYLLVFSLLLSAAYILGTQASRLKRLRIVHATFALSILLLLAATYNYAVNTSWVQEYSVLNPNAAYVHAADELAALGYGNCSIITNGWPMMLYYGYPAYTPYDAPGEYPVLFFNQVGIGAGNMTQLADATQVYNSTEFGIYMPSNMTCH